MGNLTYKAGYIKALSETKGPDDRQLLKEIALLLHDMSVKIEENDSKLTELDDFVTEIDDAVADLEDMHSDAPEGGQMDFLDFLTSVTSKPQEMKVVKNAQTSVIPFLCPECDKMFIIVDRPKSKKYICPHCLKAITPKVITADNAPTAEPAK